ncbi:MAG: GNAT family N-acetyltransferase [Bacteroidota bacterium]|nr:GNAT family N-acetyltransferase [Bacteroidota bacterium]
MKIREAEEKDIEGIIELYRETVRAVNAKDYNEEQIEIWSAGAENYDNWKKPISEQYFLVAVIDDIIVGLSSITPVGYLDFMYVHKDFQRRGIAKKLLIEIERKAAEQMNDEIFSHVSKTAKGFFEKYGYVYSGDDINKFKGVEFMNSIMKKKLRLIIA